MSALVFVDTNVLIYERDIREPRKHAAAAAWVQHLWESRAGRLSYQVLAEFYVAVTRKLRPGMPADEAKRYVRSLAAWRPAVVDAQTLESAWALEARYRLAFWDALILASAKASRCAYLLSEDFQAGQDLAGVTVVSPFAARPADLR